MALLSISVGVERHAVISGQTVVCLLQIQLSGCYCSRVWRLTQCGIYPCMEGFWGSGDQQMDLACWPLLDGQGDPQTVMPNVAVAALAPPKPRGACREQAPTQVRVASDRESPEPVESER